MKRYVHAAAGVLLAMGMLLVGTINLERIPPLWWDEGWTLMVARTWVQLGHYARLLNGELASPGLEAAFPVTAPVALSFRLFGVGIWQGRLVGVIFTVLTFALMYHLASRLYNRRVALGMLIVLLFMSPHPTLHPILMGRQVLGEMPMLFYLLAGYAFFLAALQRSTWFLPVAMVFWGLALRTKLQVLPFWTVSLLIPLVIMLFRRRWKSVGQLGTGLLGALIVSRLLLWLQQVLLSGQTVPGSPLQGLFEITALVPLAHVRLGVLLVTLKFGLATLLGLSYTTVKFVRNRSKEGLGTELEVVQLAILTLAGSWFAWYLLLATWWPRYLFPAIFLGSISLAVLLDDLTEHFSLSSTVQRVGYALTHLRFDRQSVSALLAIAIVVVASSATLKMLHRSYFISSDTSVLEAADYLNTYTSPNSLIETYESELCFLLDRRYHYPPDQIHIELLRRTDLKQDAPIDYDPLTADPDYLVVGPRFIRWWPLYDPVLATGAFRFIRAYGNYNIYERVR